MPSSRLSSELTGRAAWRVLKFGGTSVSDPRSWATIARRVEALRAAGHPVALVLSALSGVTDLLEIWCDSTDVEVRAGLWRKIARHHRQLAVSADVEVADLLDQMARDLSGFSDNTLTLAERARVLALGEVMSTRLAVGLLARHGVNARWRDARDWLQSETVASDSPKRHYLAARCSVMSDPALLAHWKDDQVVVTQGFCARDAHGDTVLLGRGGSDTSAAYLGARLQARMVEIWTDVPGLFSADPRYLPHARLLRHLSYDEALELAATGARVIHPRCIRAARDAALPLTIRDTRRPGMMGSRVGDDLPVSQGIKAVTSRDDMLVLLLQNRRPLEAVGFLSSVFQVFAQAGVSVDLVATSETTTTVALEREGNHLDEEAISNLIEALSDCCRVAVHGPCASIGLIGRGISDQLGGAGLPVVPGHGRLWLASFSANDVNLSLVVEQSRAQHWLRALHERWIDQVVAADGDSGTFGPTWHSLQQTGDTGSP